MSTFVQCKTNLAAAILSRECILYIHCVYLLCNKGRVRLLTVKKNKNAATIGVSYFFFKK